MGIKNNFFFLDCIYSIEKEKSSLNMLKKKKAKALESEISLFSKFPCCNFPTNGSRSFSFPSNKLKLKVRYYWNFNVLKNNQHAANYSHTLSHPHIFTFFFSQIVRVTSFTMHNKLVAVATTSFLSLDHICGYAFSLLIIFFKFQNHSFTRYPAIPLKHI